LTTEQTWLTNMVYACIDFVIYMLCSASTTNGRAFLAGLLIYALYLQDLGESKNQPH